MKRTRGSRSGSRLAAGHGAGQPLLAVKAVARGEDHVRARPAIHRGPEGFLNRLAAAGGPQHLLAARAARAGDGALRPAARWRGFRVRSRRCRRSAARPTRTVALRHDCPGPGSRSRAATSAAGLCPRFVTSTPEVKSASLPPFGRPVIRAALRASTARLGVNVRMAVRLDGRQPAANVVRRLFAGMLDGGRWAAADFAGGFASGRFGRHGFGRGFRDA